MSLLPLIKNLIHLLRTISNVPSFINKKELQSIAYHYYFNADISKLSTIHKIPESRLRKISSRINKCLKQRNKVNINVFGKQSKLKEEYMDCIRNIVAENKDNPITREIVRTNLLKKSPDLNSVSLITIGRKLKNNLEMIYKRLTKVSSKLLNQESKLKMARSALIIQALLKDEIEIIFLEKCSI